MTASIEERLIQADKISSINEKCIYFSQILYLHAEKLPRSHLAIWGKKWLQLASESLSWKKCQEIITHQGNIIGLQIDPAVIEINLWKGYVYTTFQRKEALQIFNTYLNAANSLKDRRLILWGSLLSADARSILLNMFNPAEMTVILETFQSMKEEEGIIRSLLARGRMYRAAGDFDKAELDFRQSCGLALKTERVELLAQGMTWLGLSQRDQGKIEKAKTSLRDALMLSLEKEVRRIAALSSLHYGRMLITEKPEGALKLLDQSARFAKERDDPVALAWAYNVIGEICQSLGQPERAIIFFDKTIGLPEFPDTEPLFWANFSAARILMAIGEDEWALPYAEKAAQINIAKEMRSSYALDSVWNMHARGLVALIKRNYEEAKQMLLPIRILSEKKNLDEANLIADELENAIINREIGQVIPTVIEKKELTKKLRIFSPFSRREDQNGT